MLVIWAVWERSIFHFWLSSGSYLKDIKHPNEKRKLYVINEWGNEWTPICLMSHGQNSSLTERCTSTGNIIGITHISGFVRDGPFVGNDELRETGWWTSRLWEGLLCPFPPARKFAPKICWHVVTVMQYTFVLHPHILYGWGVPGGVMAPRHHILGHGNSYRIVKMCDTFHTTL